MVKARAKGRSQSASRAARRGWWIMALALAGAAGLAWHYRTPAQGYANVSAAYAARVACSCRFVAGRSLADCEKDKLKGMELVTLVEDVDAQSVTARFPLLASETATLREGYGCVLQRWDG